MQQLKPHSENIARTLTVLEQALIATKNAVAGLRGNEGEKIVANQGGIISDIENDPITAADEAAFNAVRQTITANPDSRCGYFWAEGHEEEKHQLGHLWWCVDELDGTGGYVRGRDIGAHPYGCCITALKRRDNATFSDICYAGFIDMRPTHDYTVLVWRENAAYHTVMKTKTFPEGVRCRTSGKTTFDPKKFTFINWELYYEPSRRLLTEAFEDIKKGVLFRNPNAAAFEGMLVATGHADGFVCLGREEGDGSGQKQDVGGAIYAAVKGAGGYVCAADGSELDDVPFLFNTQTPMMAFATEELALKTVRRIQNTKKI